MPRLKTILVVDDDSTIRDGLQTMLRAHGYNTFEAEDGVEAKDLINEYHPDLVILDMMMPRWGGFAVLEHFQDNPAAPRFIMLTAHDGAKHKAYAKQIGVLDYIQKPYSMDRLLQKIERHFQPSTMAESLLDAAAPVSGGRVLLVDVHKPLLRAVKHCVEEEGRGVDTADSRAEADRKARTTAYGVIVLDLMSAKTDGLALLTEWRKAGIATDIMVLTAKNTAKDRVQSLDLGADDCMTRPFQLPELLARLRALARRRRQVRDPILLVHDLEIDTQARTVKRGGQPIPLTQREFALLHLLADHRGTVVTRSMIWESLYPDRGDGASNVIDVYIRYLRTKIDSAFPKKLILTRWGEGYLLRGDHE